MSNIAIVYWSGTGNTGAMADAIKAAAEGAGATVAVMGPDEFSAARLDEFDAVVFGCSAQGDEELEPFEFEPMFAGCEAALSGRTVALFGSYEWNEGEWMQAWKGRVEAAGAKLVDAVIAYDYPDDAALEKCAKLAADVVAAVA